MGEGGRGEGCLGRVVTPSPSVIHVVGLGGCRLGLGLVGGQENRVANSVEGGMKR